MDTSFLEGLGLTKSEIKLYISLLETGTTKVGRIIEKSGLASSAVHNCLNSLSEKGLLTYVKKGKIKHYQAVAPKRLIEIIDEKRKRILEVLPELEAKQKGKETQEAEIFEGTKGIFVMLNQLIEDSKPRDEYLFFSYSEKEHSEEMHKTFQKYDLIRKEKGLVVKGLAVPGADIPSQKRKTLQIKYPSTPIPKGLTIFKNRVCFYAWGEKPVGYMIKSEQIAQLFRKLFEEIWEKEK
ncbi:MAG: helix-turn-helix domain-containing protein [archaeon]|jgi:sugar-specific transcriptional regulator TrmB